MQNQPLTGPDDQAQWLDETLAGLGLDRVHLLGVSIGGWTATNAAVRRAGRSRLVDVVGPGYDVRDDPGQSDIGVDFMYLPGVPDAVLRRVLGGSPAAPRSTTHCRRRR